MYKGELRNANTESNEENGEKNPWEKMAEEVLNESAIEKTEEASEQEKKDWLYDSVEEAIEYREDQLEELHREYGNEYLDVSYDAYNAKERLDFLRLKEKVLENINFDGEGGVLGGLQREYVSASLKLVNLEQNGSSKDVIDKAFWYYSAASELLGDFGDEMKRRGWGNVDESSGDEAMVATGEEKANLKEVDLDDKIEELDEEIEKREDSLNFLLENYGENDRDNGNAILSARSHLRQKKADRDTFKALVNLNGNDSVMDAERAKELAERRLEELQGIKDMWQQKFWETSKGSEERKQAWKMCSKFGTYIDSLGRVMDESFGIKLLSEEEEDEDEGGSKMDERLDRNSEIDERNQETVIEQYEEPVSYKIERSLTYPATTLTVGQEIPDSWFESRTDGGRGEGGFGAKLKTNPLVEHYLSDILGSEFVKIPENERKRYDRLAISKALNEEAKRTKKIPNVAAIMEANKK